MNTPQPFSYSFADYWSDDKGAGKQLRTQKGMQLPKLLGVEPAIDADMREAEQIIARAPTSSPLDVFSYFADLTAVGSTGEAFNSRWMFYENPVIVWFFHATQTQPRGDCTSWCAAFLSWTLERCGLSSRHSASSQDYAEYGLPAALPAAGDIVVFRSQRNPAQGHVALFLEQQNGRIRVIGGNQSAGVHIPSCPPGFGVSRISREWREKSDAYQCVIGVRRAVSP
jgi:uncharacterized protein (TIGR02594 family)